MSVDILIVRHRYDRLIEATTHTIKLLAEHWRQMGLTVGVQQGPSRFGRTNAALAINHVSLTVTPAPYLNYLARFPIVANRELSDTSKSKYCRGLLACGSDYEGPVIVKTELNFGGYAECKLQKREQRDGVRRYLRYLLQPLQVQPPEATFSDPYAYPIYDHPSLVPVEVWSTPHLVVQKFQPERDSTGRYRLRCWYVFGDRGFHVVTVANEPIVKGRNMVERRVITDATPPELEALRKQLHVDFGRFDYVMIDGSPVVFDINRTPISSTSGALQYAPQWRDLAEGVKAFLRSANLSPCIWLPNGGCSRLC